MVETEEEIVARKEAEQRMREKFGDSGLKGTAIDSQTYFSQVGAASLTIINDDSKTQLEKESPPIVHVELPIKSSPPKPAVNHDDFFANFGV